MVVTPKVMGFIGFFHIGWGGIMALFKRRDFIKTVGASAMAVNFIGCAKKIDKPNLLFLWTDEQRSDTMAVYGNHKIHAPNFNKLAQDSVIFQNAYVSQPVCTPSRSTVMTGLWPHMNSCTENNIALPEKVHCLPEMVNDFDYRTGYFGKWHLGDEIFAQHGFEEWISIEDGYWRYYREDKDINQKSDYHYFLEDLGYKPDTDRGTFSRGFAARLPLEHCKPKFLENHACDFIKRHRNEPFMLYVNFLEPHMPFYGPLDNQHDPKEIDLPINFNDPLEDDEPLAYRLKREDFLKNGYEQYDLKKEEDWRQLISKYWGLVTQVDLSIGKILKTLDDLGLSDNTIVVFTSDHGDMMGSHHLLAKTVMYEEAVKVPWLIRFPQFYRGQNIVESPVSHIDMVPTLLDLMELNTDTQLPGQSLTPLIKSNESEAKDVFIQWHPMGNLAKGRNPAGSLKNTFPGKKHSTRTVVTREGWKLCLRDRDKNQLYNLNKDPGETTNLYYKDGNKEIITKLADKIFNWQDRVKDNLNLMDGLKENLIT
jgi:arylsulfatase A-like enzyme